MEPEIKDLLPLIAGESNIGISRAKNEDGYCIVAPPGFNSRLAVVSDGIGGHIDGEVASMYCCRKMMASFLRCGGSFNDSTAREEFLRTCAGKINRHIFDSNAALLRPRPMGCTLVCAIFTPDELSFCSIGDSRLYEFDRNEEKLTQLTVDDIAEDGVSLSSAVGVGYAPAIKTGTVPFSAEKYFLLCSDGLHHFVNDDDISQTLAGASTPRMAVSMLMRRALLRNAADNITIIVAGSGETAASPSDR